MTNADIQAEIQAARALIDDATTKLTQCENDIAVANRIEAANRRDIKKLQEHTANLQQKAGMENPRSATPTRGAPGK